MPRRNSTQLSHPSREERCIWIVCLEGEKGERRRGRGVLEGEESVCVCVLEGV